MVRLLSYSNELKPGQQLGKAHIDRNFGTLQVFESHPALVLEFSEERVNYRPIPGKALAFTGGKAEQYTRSALRGVKHSIEVPLDFALPTEENPKPRQSIVFFAHIYF